MENEFIGAIKIKDGLFIGDEFAAQDLEFIITNKVTHIINCAGRQLANYWESLGVVYLTYNWLDSQNQIVFDQKGEIVTEIFDFIEEAHGNGDSVLVHSERGQSRSCCVIAGYFMKRFKWSLYKTLEFLASRRPDLEIRDSFYYQLVNLESRLSQEAGGNISGNWFEVTPDMDIEELLLRNTFLNAKNAPLDEHLVNPQIDLIEKGYTINWGDERTNDSSQLAIYLNDEHIMKFKLAPPRTFVKSILKGSGKIFKLFNDQRGEGESQQNLKKSASVSGLRVNKSLKTLHEDKPNASSSSGYSTSLKKGVLPSGGTRTIDLNDKPKSVKFSQPQTLPRSSSASHFDKEKFDIPDTTSSAQPVNQSAHSHKASGSGYRSNNSISGSTVNEKPPVAKSASSLNGNIINLTINNFLGPMNNVNNLMQANNVSGTSSEKGIGQTSKSKVNDSTGSANADKKYDSNGSINLNEGHHNNPHATPSSAAELSKILGDPHADKNSLNYLAAKQLKMAIEKKLSKDTRKPQDSSGGPVSDDLTTQNTDNNMNINVGHAHEKADGRMLDRPPRDNRDLQEIKALKSKEYSRPTDMKVNYQVLLKNRETPPPRQREEAKKNPEAIYKKTLTKNSLNSGKSKENTNPSASTSYLQSLFPTSYMQLNSYTPSAGNNNPNLEKRTPASTKATSSSQLNFGPTANLKPTAYGGAHHSSSNSQNFEKNYASSNALLDSYLKTNVTPSSNQANQPYAFKAQVNNFMNQAKSHPIKASHEKIDRPRSTGIGRSATPNIPLGQNNKGGINSTSRFDRKENSSTVHKSSLSGPSSHFAPSLRSFSPSLKPNQSVRKDSPSAQAAAKYRQRSSSPSQNASYNTLFSTGSGSKPKWKF